MINWKNIPGLEDALGEAGLTCYQRDGQWIVAPNVETVQAFIDSYVPSPSIRKMVGVEFAGVMCSATSADQSGLMAVLTAIQMQGPNFLPTRFEFENGTSLTITLANYQSLAAVWLPFRQSFFLDH